jgi:hypothetical protein
MATANAAVIYPVGGWTTNGSQHAVGNYQLTVTDVGSTFKWQVTINPWNAEALGLFMDFGNVEIPNSFVSSGITNTSTSPLAGGAITLFAQDTTSASCGTGCNLKGLSVPLATPDGEWELVFRLATQGYQGIQTWEWTTPDFGLTEASFGVAAIRSQQLCSTGDTLPGDINDCEGSEKVWANPYVGPVTPPVTAAVSEPGSLALAGLALVGMLKLRRRKAA